jgi:hypothetical protein
MSLAVSFLEEDNTMLSSSEDTAFILLTICSKHAHPKGSSRVIEGNGVRSTVNTPSLVDFLRPRRQSDVVLLVISRPKARVQQDKPIYLLSFNLSKSADSTKEKREFGIERMLGGFSLLAVTLLFDLYQLLLGEFGGISHFGVKILGHLLDLPSYNGSAGFQQGKRKNSLVWL